MRFIRYGLNFFSQHKVRFWACLLGFASALATVFTLQGYLAIASPLIKNHSLLSYNSFLVVEKGSNLIQILPFDSAISENYVAEFDTIPGIQVCIPLIFQEFSNDSVYSWWGNVLVGVPFKDVEIILGDNIQNNLISGKWPFDLSEDYILLGSEVVQSGWKVGDRIFLHNSSYVIGGILDTIDPLFDRCIFADFSKVQSVYQMERLCSSILIVTEPFIQGQNLDQDKNQEGHIKDNYPELKVINQAVYASSTEEIFGSLEAFSQVVGIFPFIICLVFLVVLTQMSLNARHSELCILRAIGVSSSKLLLVIQLDLLIIGLFGFIFAIIIGYGYFGIVYAVFPMLRGGRNFVQYLQNMHAIIPDTVYFHTAITCGIVIVLLAFQTMWKVIKLNIVSGIKHIT
ncbi:MAG: ABC transporter permease [Promethearchaeota archaeon]